MHFKVERMRLRAVLPGLVLAGATLLMSFGGSVGLGANPAPPNPTLVKLDYVLTDAMENTPVVMNGRPLLVNNVRPGGVYAQGKDAYLRVNDLTTGQEISRFGQGHSFVSAYVDGSELSVFSTAFNSFGAVMDMKTIDRYTCTDSNNWSNWSSAQTALVPNPSEQFFNSSVCRDGQSYVMAYESGVAGYWDFSFARSTDLANWTRVPDLRFADLKEGSTCANPTIRYTGGCYYLMYGINTFNGPGTRYEYEFPTTRYVTGLARSTDLATWEVSPTRGPMIDVGADDKRGTERAISATDADLYEYGGKTYIYYAVGDQNLWADIHALRYDGSMQQMFEAYFPAGVPTIKFDARTGAYDYSYSVPEPSAIIMLITGPLGLLVYVWRKHLRMATNKGQQ
jgi:hypothetical protein